MSAELVSVDDAVAHAQQTLTDICAFIAQCESAEELQAANGRIRLAREWAKIHKIAASVHVDLLRVEALCLRRIAALDAVAVLPVHARPAAEHFAGLSEDDLDSFLLSFAASSTAVGCYRAWCKDQTARSCRQLGVAFATGEVEVAGEEHLESTIRAYTRDARAAMAVLLEDYAGRSFTISEMADDVLDSLGLYAELEGVTDLQYIREGVGEVCRSAVRSAPVLTLNGYKLPRFVTCYSDHVEGFLRVPFANASPRQFAQMLELRNRQFEEDQRALARLMDAYNEVLASCPAGPNEPMGEPSSWAPEQVSSAA